MPKVASGDQLEFVVEVGRSILEILFLDAESTSRDFRRGT